MIYDVDNVETQMSEDVIIAATITGVIGLILCGCTCLLIIFCIQSQNYERSKKLERMNSTQQYVDKIRTASANTVILSQYDSNIIQIDVDNSDTPHPPNNNTSSDSSEDNFNTKQLIHTHDQTQNGDTNDTDGTEEEDDDKDPEEKEGELITTNLVGIHHMANGGGSIDRNNNELNASLAMSNTRQRYTTSINRRIIDNPYSNNAQLTVDKILSNKNIVGSHRKNKKHSYHRPPIHYIDNVSMNESNNGDIDYEKMAKYLNEDVYDQQNMSSSSGENILEEMRTNISIGIAYD